MWPEGAKRPRSKDSWGWGERNTSSYPLTAHPTGPLLPRALPPSTLAARPGEEGATSKLPSRARLTAGVGTGEALGGLSRLGLFRRLRRELLVEGGYIRNRRHSGISAPCPWLPLFAMALELLLWGPLVSLMLGKG